MLTPPHAEQNKYKKLGFHKPALVSVCSLGMIIHLYIVTITTLSCQLHSWTW